MDNTLIVFTSDHGDYLGDHWLGEKELFHECSVRVPLIVVDPTPRADATRGTQCDALVEQIDLVPSFLDTAELALDRKLIDDLLPCLREIAPICEGLEDTVSLAYTDVYMADLAFHQNVKQAAKRGVPGTDTIYDDLMERFPGRLKAEPPAPPTPCRPWAPAAPRR